MIRPSRDALEKQISLDRDLVAVNGVYCKQMFVDILGGYERIIIDMQQVEDCDTAGVQLLLALKKSAEAMKREVRLRYVPSVVTTAMNKYGFSLEEMFDIEA